jgi:hypothetical protein
MSTDNRGKADPEDAAQYGNDDYEGGSRGIADKK